MTDVLQNVQREAIAWFEQLSSASNVLRSFLDESEMMNRRWGFGNNPSPVRHYFTGYMALSVNDWENAKLHLEKALESGCFSSEHERLAHSAADAVQQIPFSLWR